MEIGSAMSRNSDMTSTSTIEKIKATATDSTDVNIGVRLADLAIAPENPRADVEEPEEDLESLADSLDPAAAGQLCAIIVRPGKGKKERPFMAVDGSRRFRGWAKLVERGTITLDFVVNAKLVTTDEEIAAAVIESNKHRKNLSPADNLIAIRRMIDRKMSVTAMAKALNEDPANIRRYSIVAALPTDALEAYRANKITMKTLKLLARVKDKAEQETLAHRALHGNLWEGAISSIIGKTGFSVASNLMQVAGVENYQARGGNLENDLLQEMPDRATDTSLAISLFAEQTAGLATSLRDQGLEVIMASVSDFEKPDGLKTPYVSPTDEQQPVIDTANQAYEALCNSYIGDGPTIRVDMDALAEIFDAKLFLARSKIHPMTVTHAVIHPSTNRIPVDVTFFTTTEQFDAWYENRQKSYASATYTNSFREPGDAAPVRTVEVDAGEETHAFHRQATIIASRGLQNSISQNYQVSLTLLVSHLFSQTLIRYGDYDTSNLLQITVGRKLGAKFEALPDLDEPIVNTLRATKEAFLASGKTPLQFVADLEFSETQTLLSNLVAFSADVSEDRTDVIKTRARADAGEVSDMLGHDIRSIYMPDADLYGKCTKKQLQAYAKELDLAEEDLPTKKADLASFVAEKGFAANWAPAALSFQAPTVTAAESETDDDSVEHGELDIDEDDGGLEALSDDDEDDLESETFADEELLDA